MITASATAFDYKNYDLNLGSRPYDEAYSSNDYNIVSIDGRDRTICLAKVLSLGLDDSSILVLDNTERISGFGGRYSGYMALLKGMNILNFEQPYIQGLDPSISSYPDRSGNRVNHRWITTIAFNASVNYTSLGKLL